MKVKTIVVPFLAEEMRLDLFLCSQLPSFSRSFFRRLIKEGQIRVNNEPVKPGYSLKEADIITLDLTDEVTSSLKPENIPLNIIYEDEDLLVLDKPAGLVVHPGAGHKDGTLVNALLYHEIKLSSGSDEVRPGIVHRLDKETSGLLLVAKNDQAHRKLATQLQNRTMKRIYLALVIGEFNEEEGEIIAPLGRDANHRYKRAVDLVSGKEAKTYFQVEERFNGYTLLRCELETGRTHQIRVHLAFIGHPVVGDRLYLGKKSPLYPNGHLLHACQLGLIHPTTNQAMTFKSPLPEYFAEILRTLRNS